VVITGLRTRVNVFLFIFDGLIIFLSLETTTSREKLNGEEGGPDTRLRVKLKSSFRYTLNAQHRERWTSLRGFFFIYFYPYFRPKKEKTSSLLDRGRPSVSKIVQSTAFLWLESVHNYRFSVLESWTGSDFTEQ